MTGHITETLLFNDILFAIERIPPHVNKCPACGDCVDVLTPIIGDVSGGDIVTDHSILILICRSEIERIRSGEHFGGTEHIESWPLHEHEMAENLYYFLMMGYVNN